MTTIPTDSVDASAIHPIDHAEGMRLFAQELDRTVAMLRTLDDAAWSAQTDCPDWDVRRMYLHVLGACEAGASMRENIHQLRAARAHQKANGGPLEAALSAWMHRIDACRATGAELALDDAHDGRIVADVVAEWARRHGRSFSLVLTGPAGGRFAFESSSGSTSDATESVEMDAVEFCRILAGRAEGAGLLTTIVPF
jgi:hypothetical protein